MKTEFRLLLCFVSCFFSPSRSQTLNKGYFPFGGGHFDHHGLGLDVGQGHGTQPETEYFDLGYDLDENSVFYPGQRWERFLLYKDTQGFNRTATGNIPYFYAAYSFCMSEHGGTHMDAPFHFNKAGWRMNEIPQNRMVDVPMTVIDVEQHVFALNQPDEFILEVEHIREHEAKYGRIPPGSVVMVRTGWSRFWSDKQRYMGWDNSTIGARPTLHYPGLSGNSASWLVRERQVVGVGIDTASPDIGDLKGNPVVHIILCENQVYMLENVANLDYLLKRTRHDNPYGCNLRLFVMPVKTRGTGGPVRLFAYCKT